MKKMDFMKYEAPEVEVIEVEVEKGYLVSPGTGDSATNPDMDM